MGHRLTPMNQIKNCVLSVFIGAPSVANFSLYVLIVAFLFPRMKFLMYGFQPVLIDVGVNLRRADIAVAEEFLDDA